MCGLLSGKSTSISSPAIIKKEGARESRWLSLLHYLKRINDYERLHLPYHDIYIVFRDSCERLLLILKPMVLKLFRFCF